MAENSLIEMYSPLAAVDWYVIAAFFVVTLCIGLYFSRRATSGMADYFVAGRKMTWWVAGTSIVATSFAADTPLVVAGWMRTSGLERNWFWWGGIMGMMLCTFFFARLWRRADILTDVEFNELRYAGKPAASLRIFHAGYRSLIQNTLVMGWVTLAMTKILEVTLNIPTLVFLDGHWLPLLVEKGVDLATIPEAGLIAHWPLVGLAVIPAKVTGIVLCLGVAAFYSAVSGLWGVMATDVFQFAISMLGAVLLMYFSFHAAGGPEGMLKQARAVVSDGRVINHEFTPRRVAEHDPLYAAAGLIRPSEDGTGWQWNADGLSAGQVEERLAVAGGDVSAEVLGKWESAYAISLTSLTDFEVVDALVDAGVLARDHDGNGSPLSYLRLVDLDPASLQLPAEIQGSENAGIGEVAAAWRKDHVVDSRKIASFLPPFDLRGGGLMAVWSLVVFLGLQWWVGGEGGGFLAQRLFSCKNEKHSVLAMLWFNFLNFAVRPWPWIVVGVVSLFLIPDITAYGKGFDQEHAYVVMMMKLMPVGLKGLMVASLMAAYMSTISTHVNFGASYVVNDLYKRFIHRNGTEKGDIRVSQIASILLAVLAGIYAFFSESVSTGWFTMFELMSGTGFVVLLRWYWWRINAWSELSAMFSSLGLYLLMNNTHVFHHIFRWIGAPEYLLDEYAVRFTINLFFTTLVWLTVTFLTPPEKEEHLINFYRRIRPPGWWMVIAEKAGYPDHLRVGRVEWICWALGVTGLFGMIITLGKCCFGFYLQAIPYAIYSMIATGLILRFVRRMDWSVSMSATGDES
jgi:Na+/proline symporter